VEAGEEEGERGGAEADARAFSAMCMPCALGRGNCRFCPARQFSLLFSSCCVARWWWGGAASEGQLGE